MCPEFVPDFTHEGVAWIKDAIRAGIAVSLQLIDVCEVDSAEFCDALGELGLGTARGVVGAADPALGAAHPVESARLWSDTAPELDFIMPGAGQN